MTNNYKCFYYYKNKKTKEYFRNGNKACWAGLSMLKNIVNNMYLYKNDIYMYHKDNKYSGIKSYPENKHFDDNDFDFKTIYIKLPLEHSLEHLNPEYYNKYVTRIVNLINKITTCKKVYIDNILYIKYKTLDNYSSDLLLLNIIRMLWYTPQGIYIENFIRDILKQNKNKDSLAFILETIINNLKEDLSYGQEGDHSCIYKKMKIKTSKQLLEFKGEQMQAFLIT